MTNIPWRVGRHVPIHVYEGDEPIATFLDAEHARRCVDAVNAIQRVRELTDEWVAQVVLDKNDQPGPGSLVSAYRYDAAIRIRRALGDAA